MKKLLLFSAILFAFGASAQTIDTNIAKPYAVVLLRAPFVASFPDTTKARYLNVSITDDNLKDAATFHWVLFGNNNKALAMGDVQCNGNDYKLWDGASLYVFTYVADKLGLGIK
jgi:hypothetical protein